jgi:general secretion pathway protein K
LTKPEGFALVLVLWVLSLLTIMAGSFALSMRRETAIVSGGRSDAEAMAVAESGLAIAELMLLNPDQRQGWRSDGSLYQIDYTDAKVRVELYAETGKVDLNTADEALLKALMAEAPVGQDMQAKLVSAILDWRDADDLIHIDGAEKNEYKKAGLRYQPRNKPFQSIEELQLVLGFDAQLYKWLENVVTVYSKQPKVDLTKASKSVLQVLSGADDKLLDQYLVARRESAINGLPAPAFMPVEGAYPTNRSTSDSAQIDAGQSNVSQQKDGQGNVQTPDAGAMQDGLISVIAEAQLDSGAAATFKALIKKSDNPESPPFQILKWQRNFAGEGSLFTDEKDELLVRQYAEPQFND